LAVGSPTRHPLYLPTKDDPDPGSVSIHKAATRDGDTVAAPELIHTIEVGTGPYMILPNEDCSILVVANKGEGDHDDFLINLEGSVSLINGRFRMQVPLQPSRPSLPPGQMTNS